jgi:DNA-binding XRE family transcriptional regulator
VYQHGGSPLSLPLCLLAYTNVQTYLTRKTPQPQPALGLAIRAARKKTGLSLRSFAPKTGLTASTLSLIERGEANPTWGAVRAVAAALDMPVSRLARQAEKLEN